MRILLPRMHFLLLLSLLVVTIVVLMVVVVIVAVTVPVVAVAVVVAVHTLDTITDLPTNFGITNSSLKTLRLNNPKT